MSTARLYTISLKELLYSSLERKGFAGKDCELAWLILFDLLKQTELSVLDPNSILKLIHSAPLPPATSKANIAQLSEWQLAARNLEQFAKTNSFSQREVLLQSYLLALARRGCSQATIKNYNSDIRQIYASSPQARFEELFTETRLIEFAKSQERIGLAPATIKRKLTTIAQFAKWQAQHGALEENQAEKLGHFALNFGAPIVDPPTPSSFQPITIPDELIQRHDHQSDLFIANEEQRNSAKISSNYRTVEQHAGTSKITERKKPISAEEKEVDKETQTPSENTIIKIKPFGTMLQMGLSTLALLVSVLGFGLFAQAQFFSDPTPSFAFPSTLTRPARTLSFQGRLTDVGTNPVTGSTAMTFRLFDTGPGLGGTELWSGTCNVDPDQDGIFATGLGDECGDEISDDVFSENSSVWLQVEVGSEVLTPRQSIKSVPYALNTETLQGYPASSSATANTVPVVNSSGEVVFAVPSGTSLRSTTGMSVSGTTLTLSTVGNGNITLDPDGLGETLVKSNLQVDGAATVGGRLVAQNNLQVMGTSTLTGQATLLNNLQVDGAATIGGLLRTQRSLQVDQYATVGASLAVGYSSAPAGPGNAVFSGNVGIGTTNPNNFRLQVNGNIGPQTTNTSSLGSSSVRFANVYSVLGNYSGQITSSLATGTAPFAVTSTTVNTNLNADLWDGYDVANAPFVNNTTNTTLTRSGTGPYTLAINLGNANTWTATQTFSNATYSALFTGGNVGIGSTSPGAQLDVNGTLRANNTVTFSGIGSGTGTALCRDASNNIVTCAGGGTGNTLQAAYDNGNTISTTTGRNIAFTLPAGLATATSFTLTNNHVGATTAFNLTNANASGTNTNGILVNQTGAGTLTNGVNITRTAGVITNGLNFTGTFTNLINAPNFSVTNAGLITGVGVNSQTGLIQGTGGLTITGANVNLNDSSNSDVNIATGTSTGTINLGGTGAQSINIGSGAAAKTIAIGNTNTTTGITMNVGTGNFVLNGVGASTYSIGSSTTTGTITIGGTAQTGAINIGIGTGVQTLNFGTGGTGAKTVTVGSTATGSNTTINGTNIVLGAQGDATNEAVRADRSLTLTSDTNVTITNSGTAQNLTADRGWTLGWTGQLAIGRGGTGASSFGANRVPFINSGDTAFTSDENFVFSGGNLGVGTTSPVETLTVAGNLGLRNGTLWQEIYPNADNTLVYLPFSESSGTTAFDTSSQGNDGTQSNATWGTGKYGNAITFDGSTSSLSIPTTGEYPTTWSQPFSISTWMYVPSAATWSNSYTGSIIARGSYTTSHGLTRSATNNQIMAYVRHASGSVAASATIERDKWQHVVMTWNGTQARIYVDGLLIATSASTTPTGSPGLGNWLSGTAMAFSGSTGNRFQGSLDELSIYNKELSINEIRTQYLMRSVLNGSVRANAFKIINTADQELIRVINNGNVGIGTTSPSTFKLETAGSIGPSADNVYNLGSSGRRWANIYATNFVGTVTPSGFTEGPVIFGGASGALAQDNALWWDNTNKRLGIGTTAPGSPLHVLTPGVADTQTIVLTLGSNTSSRPVLQFSESVSSALTAGMSIEYDGRGSGGANQLNINDITGSPVVTIQSGGYVGIGTTGPVAKLDVSAGSASTVNIASPPSGNATMLLGRVSGSPSIKSTSDWFIAEGGSTNGNAGLNYWSTGNVILANGGGNVGIGSAAPSQRLDVSGNIRFSGALMPNNTAGTSGQFLISGGAGNPPTWTSTVPATSIAFSGITSGTNTQAAMVVGAGGSLNYTSSGTINASSLVGATWVSPGAIGSTTANTGTFTTLTGTTINATTGFRINNAAASGQYLRGNGTNFVSSAIQAADVPTLNQDTTGSSYYVRSIDTRAVNDEPDDFGALVKFDFKSNSTNGLSDGGTYNGVMTWRKYGNATDFSGGPALQLAYTDNANLWLRTSSSATAWNSWNKIWHGGNDGSGSGLDADLLDGISSASFVQTSRTLTLNGTTNQITVSPTGAQDLSANRSWTLSLPQNIHTSATPTFGGMTLNGDLNFGPEANRQVIVGRRTTTAAGSLLTLQAGGARSGQTDLAGGELRLSSGIATGTGSSFMSFYTTTAGTTGTTDRTPTEKMRILANGNVGIGTTSPGEKLDINGNLRFTIATSRTITIQAPSGNGNGGNLYLTAGNHGAGLMPVAGGNVYIDGGTNNSGVGSNVLLATQRGNVGIKTTTPGYDLTVNGNINATSLRMGGHVLTPHSSADGFVIFNKWDAANTHFYFRKVPNRDSVSGYTDLMIINNSGGISMPQGGGTYNNSTGAWVNGSDRSFKTNIADLTKYDLSTINKIRPTQYTVISSGVPQIGFIAQELQPIIPELVSSSEDGKLGVNYGGLTVVLTRALQQLDEKVDSKGEIVIEGVAEQPVVRNQTTDSLITITSASAKAVIGNLIAGIGRLATLTVTGTSTLADVTTTGLTNLADLTVAGTSTLADVTTSSLSITADSLSIAGVSLREYIAGVVQDLQTQGLLGQGSVTSLPEGSVVDSLGVGDLTANNVSTGDLLATGSATLLSAQIGDLSVLENATIAGRLTVGSDTTISGTLSTETVQTQTLEASRSLLGEILAGTASVSGSITADSVVLGSTTEVSDPNQLVLDVNGSARMSALEAKVAEFEQVNAMTASLYSASISGSLTVGSIVDFDRLLTESVAPSLLQQLIGYDPQATRSGEIIAGITGIDINSIPVLDPSSLDELPVNPTLLGAHAGFFETYLQVNGNTALGGDIKVGGDLVMSGGISMRGNRVSISSVSSICTDPILREQLSEEDELVCREEETLYISTPETGALNLMNGLVLLADGKVIIDGEVTFKKPVTIDSTLLTNLVTPTTFDRPIQFQVAGASTETGEVTQSRFEIVNELGTPVATISAQGKAEFAGEVNADSLALGSQDLSGQNPGENTQLTSSKKSGKAKITAGTSQLTIANPNVSAESLIYVTPQGSTGNQTIYVKEQLADDPNTPELNEARFTIGFDQPVNNDVIFNWWVVN